MRVSRPLPWCLCALALASAACGSQSWQNEGPVAPNVATSGKIFASNGTQYAAYVDSATSLLTVRKFSGGKWVALPDTGLLAADYDYALTVDGSTPYVAAISPTTGQLSVLQYASGAWSPVGGPGPTATTNAVFLAVKSGTAYLAFTDSNSALAVQSASGTTWTSLGAPQGTATPNAYGLALFNGTPYVFYGDSTGATLTSWTSGTQWTTVATTTVGLDADDSRCAGYAPTLTVSNGALYLAYFNSTQGAVFLKLGASTLDPIGTLGSISGGDTIECVSGTVFNGTPYVAFDDETRDSDPQPKAATVKVYQGSSWQLYAGYPSNNDIESTMLTVDASNGHLYLTYEDDTLGGMTVQVR